jgi:hypothetical protein
MHNTAFANTAFYTSQPPTALPLFLPQLLLPLLLLQLLPNQRLLLLAHRACLPQPPPLLLLLRSAAHTQACAASGVPPDSCGCSTCKQDKTHTHQALLSHLLTKTQTTALPWQLPGSTMPNT